MKVYIMAAGSGVRWNNYLDTPKHLICVNGEAILSRTVRQLRELGIKSEDIIIIGPYFGYGADAITGHGYWDPFWELFHGYPKDTPKEKIIKLSGDCFYTDKCMDVILNCNPLLHGYCWIGRRGPSQITKQDHGEIWAEVILPESQAIVFNSIFLVKWMHKKKELKRCTSWEVYDHLQGPEDQRHLEPWIEIDDGTTDFDEPKDYDTWIPIAIREGLIEVEHKLPASIKNLL